MASQPLQSTSTNQPQRRLTANDLPQLLDLLQPVAHKCIFIGLQLGVSDDVIQNIRPPYPDNQTWLYKILQHRLNQTQSLTWHDVVKALQSNSVQENRLASELESWHIQKLPAPAFALDTMPHMPTQTSFQPMLGNQLVGQPLQISSSPPLSHYSIPQLIAQSPHPATLQPLAHHQHHRNSFAQSPFLPPQPREGTPLLISSNQSGMGASHMQTPSFHQTASTTPTGRVNEHLPAQHSHGVPICMPSPYQHTMQWVHNDIAVLGTKLSNVGLSPKSSTLPPQSCYSLPRLITQSLHPVTRLQGPVHHQHCHTFPQSPSFPSQLNFRGGTPLFPLSNQSGMGASQLQPPHHQTASIKLTGRMNDNLPAQHSCDQHRKTPLCVPSHYQHTTQWCCNDTAAFDTNLHNVGHHPLYYYSTPHQPHQPPQPCPPHQSHPPVWPQPTHQQYQPHSPHHSHPPHQPHPPHQTHPLNQPHLPHPHYQLHAPHQAAACNTQFYSYTNQVGPLQSNHEQLIVNYISYVKKVYRSSEVEKNPQVTKWPPTPSKAFINLVCIDRNTVVTKQEADEITQCMVCDGSVDVILQKKRPIEFNDIAKDLPDTQLKNLILVEGAPGVGKSTFAWEFCRRWERAEIAQQYRLVLLLRLRDKRMSKVQSLADLIFHSSDYIRQAVVQELEYNQGINTLVILEGFDELPDTCRTQLSVFLQLIHGYLLPLATVLVTSRPWATRDIHWECSHRIFQHIEILGFTGKQIEEYVTSVFMDEGKTANDKSRRNIEEVVSYVKTYPQIKACMYIPLNSAIVVSVFQESKAGKCILPRTMTELYSALIQTLLLRYLYGHPEYDQRRWRIRSLKNDLPPVVYSKLLAISELAYSSICTDQKGSVQLIFTDLPEGFETLGLMQSVPQLFVTQGEDMSHNFLHLTVQEFLAALHISNMSPKKQLEYYQRQKKGNWGVLKFLAGITKLHNLSPEDLKDLLLDKPEASITACRHSITPDVTLSSDHVSLMFETQSNDIVQLVLQEKTVEFRGQRGITPLDYYSLGYCIVHSHCQWVLIAESDMIGKEELRMLMAGVDTRRDTRAKVVGLGACQLRKEIGGGDGSISTEALHALFTGLKHAIHLQELHLRLSKECSSITWPDFSGLRVLHLVIRGGNKWELESLLPRLSLESLVITASDLCHLECDDIASIGKLLLSFNCPKHVEITGKKSSVTAEVAVDQHVHNRQLSKRTSLGEKRESVEYMRYWPEWYSMGYVIAHSNFQWVLTVRHPWGENIMGKEDIRMLVAGAKTRQDTSARVVGLRGSKRGEQLGGGHWPLSVSATDLHMLFTEFEVHLQELHLRLPVECSSITWPDLSGLRVLHLVISGERNWRLETLLPHLSLESLTFETTKNDHGTVVLGDCVAIGMLISSSNCLKYLHFKLSEGLLAIDPQGMESITKAMSENRHPLKSVVIECVCTFGDTAAHSLAQFITNSATLHHLTIFRCTFSAHGLLQLAKAIYHSSSLQESKLKNLTCTVHGNDEANDYAQVKDHYHGLFMYTLVEEKA